MRAVQSDLRQSWHMESESAVYVVWEPVPTSASAEWTDAPEQKPTLQIIGSDEPSTLGYWLAGRSSDEICDRLGCDASTAKRLRRCGTPCLARWWIDVEAIAAWLRLDPLRLGALLVETEAASVKKTYAVTRGIVGVASGLGR